MIIVGAKGFAKEVLEIFAQQGKLDNLYFFDNVTPDLSPKLYNRFPVLQSIEQVQEIFKSTGDNPFVLGLGNPLHRYKLNALMTSAGGKLTSIISPLAQIGHFGNVIGEGCCIMTGTVITNDVTIGRGGLVNLNCTIGHDSIIGDFVEMSPDVNVSGNCRIGNYCNLGTNAVILPEITLGENVVVGAGAVVTKDIPSNCIVTGVPAKLFRELDPFPG